MSSRKFTPQEQEQGEETDQIVFRYQDGDEASGEELLRRFGGHPSGPMTNLIGKYYSMLRYVRVNFKDKHTRAFISLFTADAEMREKLRPRYQYTETKAHGILTVEDLRKTCSVIPDEEFKQELRFIFLQKAKLYKHTKEDVWFPGYIKKAFRFGVYHYINKIRRSGDPYTRGPKKFIYLQDDTHYSEETLIRINPEAFVTTPIMQLDDELGNSWVRGITCAEEFLPLTPLQRLIVKMALFEGKSDRLIAEYTRLHINTINRHKLRAIRKIKEERERLLKRTDV